MKKKLQVLEFRPLLDAQVKARHPHEGRSGLRYSKSPALELLESNHLDQLLEHMSAAVTTSSQYSSPFVQQLPQNHQGSLHFA